MKYCLLIHHVKTSPDVSQIQISPNSIDKKKRAFTSRHQPKKAKHRMKIDIQVPIKDVSKDIIWSVMTDYEHFADHIEAIKKVDILEKPTNPKVTSIVGLKWSETRIMFGREETETMWVTDAKEEECYTVKSESCGTTYISKMYIVDDVTSNNGNDNKEAYVIGMSFEGSESGSTSYCHKLMGWVMGWMMKGMLEKCLRQDLYDMKAVAESLAKSST